MNDVLPLSGDGDELDLLLEVERAFAVKLDLRRLENARTVGDLHELLLATIPHTDRGLAGFLAAKAFFNLKRAIEAQKPGRTIRPSTELASVTGRFDVSRWLKRCERQTDLKLPEPELTTVATLLWLASAAAPVAAYLVQGWTGVLVALPISVFIFALCARLRRFPARFRTVGDLARTVAALNPGALTSAEAPVRTAEIWPSLQEIIRHNLGWDGAVKRTTRFF